LPITSNIQEVHDWQLIIKGLVKNRDGKILFDQMRSFDKQRLLRNIGQINQSEINQVNQILKKMLIQI